MKSIKHALTERYYTWEDAVDVAREDPEINMDGAEGEAYNPGTFEEDVEVKGFVEEGATESADGKSSKPVGQPA